MPGCYYSPAGYLPVTYSSSPTLLQSEWANRQVRSSHVKTPVASSLVEPTTSELRVTTKMAAWLPPPPRGTTAHHPYSSLVTTFPYKLIFFETLFQNTNGLLPRIVDRSIFAEMHASFFYVLNATRQSRTYFFPWSVTRESKLTRLLHMLNVALAFLEYILYIIINIRVVVTCVYIRIYIHTYLFTVFRIL